MKSIQEKHLESEFNSLARNNALIPTKIIKIRKDEYNIEITIPHKYFDDSPFDMKEDILFLLKLEHNFPFNAPKLYCLSPFCKPLLCDGRDLLENVMSQPWHNQFLLVEVVNSIPKFLLNYLDKVSRNIIPNVGQYYLDEKYDFQIINSLPLFITKVSEMYTINGNREEEVGRYLVLTDMFFLLFDYDFFNNDFITLTFWAHLKSLINMREFIQQEKCKFTWKFKGGKNYIMNIASEDTHKIVDLVMKNLMGLKIEYSVTKKNLGPKEGIIPEENIQELEKEIMDLEERIIHEDQPEQVTHLMNLYERAVRYYSALNDTKYVIFMEKTKSIMANEKYSKLFDEAKKKEKEKEKEEEKLKEEKKVEEDKKEIKENNENIKEDIKEESKKPEEDKKSEETLKTVENIITENKPADLIGTNSNDINNNKEEFVKKASTDSKINETEESKKAEELALKLLNEEDDSKNSSKSKSTVQVSLDKKDLNLDLNFDDDE